MQAAIKLSFLGIALLAFSCTRKVVNDPRVFYYNQPEGIATLDPAYAKSQPVMWAVHQIFSTLVEVDTGMHTVPLLAKRWEISSDRLTYTFWLRDDVYFHDDPVFPGGKGRHVVASDVAYSLGRIIDKRVASPGAWIFNNRVDSLHPFTALNDSMFQVRLQRPFHPILGILGMLYCSVVAREAVENYGTEFRRHPVGTGPFTFSSWEEGQALILHRNTRYFERDAEGHQLPKMEAVKISFLDSKSAEFLAFQEGKLDFVNDIDANFKDEILTRQGELKPEWNGASPFRNTLT